MHRTFLHGLAMLALAPGIDAQTPPDDECLGAFALLLVGGSTGTELYDSSLATQGPGCAYGPDVWRRLESTQSSYYESVALDRRSVVIVEGT